jgi:D-alanyl-D-alanine carboxypeptidase
MTLSPPPSTTYRHALALVFAAVLLAPGKGTAIASPPPELQQALEALAPILAAGDAAAFEKFAQTHFASALLNRRTPEQRQQFVNRLHGDLGKFVAGPPRFDGWAADVEFRPEQGDLRCSIHLELEPAPPHRIVDFAARLEHGARERDAKSVLPELPVLNPAAPKGLAASLDPYLESLAASGALSGVVSIAYEGRPVYQRVEGLADRERQTPNRLDTRFNIASIGKQFTKVAIGQLLQQGKLQLDDVVAKVLPAYPNAAAAQKLTVRQLLEHQGGVRDIFAVLREGEAPPRSNHEWYLRVASQPLDFEPGSQRRYCNGCYVVLGEIVATIAGESYEDYLARHVFAPAGMTATAFLAGSDPGANQAIGYTRQEGPGLRPASLGPGGRGSGAGGVFSTAADLLAYDRALRDGRLLDRKWTGWMFEAPEEAAAKVGLSVAGGAPGTNNTLESGAGWTVIVLTNLDPPAGEQLGTALARALIREH